jgi:hypothetical protein
LHPPTTIRAESFAITRYPDGWFDLAFGNVPFGDYKLFDPVHNRSGMSIHNHFIYKALRLTRTGGHVVVLTSRTRSTRRAEPPGLRSPRSQTCWEPSGCPRAPWLFRYVLTRSSAAGR